MFAADDLFLIGKRRLLIERILFYVSLDDQLLVLQSFQKLLCFGQSKKRCRGDRESVIVVV